MKEILGRIVAAELEERRKQGYDVEALRPLLGKASGSCDALLALSQRIKEAPIRQDWPYEEPDDLESVMAACDPTRRREASRLLSDGEIEARVRSAFLTSVCACILGKPLEEAPYGGLEDIRAAAQASGEWPLRDYVSDAMLTAWGRRNPSWVETTRGRVRYAASDDDITYTIMGMLLLEKRGKDFSHEDMRQLWLENLPIYSLQRSEEVPVDYREIDFVCLRPDGCFESSSTVGIACRTASKKIPGLEGFHFHQLRHTFTSNLLSNGAAPKDVQELLGHADVSTTMNIYAHSTREAKRSSARLLDKVVGD